VLQISQISETSRFRLDLPAQLCRQKITVWTELDRVLVHAADEPFPAWFILESQSQQNLVNLVQNGTVERVVRYGRRLV
jgi:hypothetical protein